MRHELGFFRTWAVMARNVWGARELVWQLFKRDFLAGYRKSFIGVAWLLIAPLTGIVSWVFLQRAGLFTPGEVGVPYTVYVLVGTSAWGLYMGLLQSSAQTLQAGTGLLMQVRYPHEALLFKQVAQQLSNFTIAFVANMLILLAFHVVPSWGALLLPLVALPLFLLAAGIGLILSMIAVVAMDVSRAVEIGMALLLYCTPVIYSDKITNPVVLQLVTWNPLTYLVCSCRDMVLFGRLYHPAGYFAASALAALVFMVSWRLFYVSEERLIERMV
jgi:lipopolysaccharide transport system permease protein